MHKTGVEGSGCPGACAAFKDRLLVGCGSVLRVYEMGRKKMLRKCEYKK